MWTWRKRKAPDRLGASAGALCSDDEATVADEASAFLGGSSKKWFLQKGRVVPVWAELNQVAHAEVPVLVRGAASAPPAVGHDISWQTASAVLARETVEQAGGDSDAIRRLQRERLQPLESRLVSRQSEGITPRGLVALTKAHLRGHPSTNQPF